MNTPAQIKQADIKRAVKSVIACDLPVHGVEITKDGTIRILTSKEVELENKPEVEL